MGRLLAIDYGTKRVGVAVSDPLQIISSPLDVVHSKDIYQFIKDYLQQEQVDAIIVGMPKKLDNTDTNNTQSVKGFVTRLKKEIPNHPPIHWHDERFTSKIALDAMIQAGTKPVWFLLTCLMRVITILL